VHWILKISLKELQNLVRKYLLTVESLIFRYWWQNISLAVMLVSAVTGPEVTFADRTTLLLIGMWDRATDNAWNARLRCSNSASQQSWPQPSELLNLGEAAGACVPWLHSWCRPAEVSFDWRVGIFQPDVQLIIDEAVWQWCSHLQACAWASGEYFERRL